MTKKIYIDEQDINGLLSEASWNYHYSHGGGEDSTPHYSESKFNMDGGRDTGHFGSGTYFSTYSDKNLSSSYGSNVGKDNRYIKVGDNLYRVDFDLYKNLFRVHSKKEGDVLFTMMKNLNRMYAKISRDFGKFDEKDAIYNNSVEYQIILKNSKALGLKCPSYMQLTRMAQELGKNDNRIESFSTAFMEWNGYNGVNVSGIPYYDNTTHGSVIYDLSKVDGDMDKIDDGGKYINTTDGSFSNTIAMDGWDDAEANSLDGTLSFWYDKLSSMDSKHAMRLLKNYTSSKHILPLYAIRGLGDKLESWYLRYLYQKNPTDRFGNRLCDELVSSRLFSQEVLKLRAWYWLSYKLSNGNRSPLLVNLVHDFELTFDFDDSYEEEEKRKKQFVNMLLSHVDRELNGYEKLELGLDYDEE